MADNKGLDLKQGAEKFVVHYDVSAAVRTM
jgi:hypothetical protein